MLSICVTIKNRYELFRRCIDQLLRCNVPGAELVVTDWRSTDQPVANWLPDVLKLSPYTLTLIPMGDQAPFSRGRGLNVAATWAKYDDLFFIDTDMLVAQNVIEAALAALRYNSAYFPICWSYTNPGHTKGRWRVNGKGIVAVTKTVYLKAGKWLELTQWGTEDRRFFDSVQRIVPIIRENTKGLYHQWHPTSNTLSGSRTN